MKFYTTLLLVLVHLGLYTQAQPEEKIEIKAINRQFIKRKDTTYRFYAIIPEQPVKTRPDRTYYWYKSDTILSSAGGYDGRLLDGSFRVFYPDKNLEEDGMFGNGLRTGEWKTWYPGGKIHSVIHWNDGLRDGAFTEYDLQGRKAKEGSYKKDLLSGKIKEFDADGSVSVIEYKEGKPVLPKQKTVDKPSDKPVKEGKKKKETDTGHDN